MAKQDIIYRIISGADLALANPTQQIAKLNQSIYSTQHAIAQLLEKPTMTDQEQSLYNMLNDNLEKLLNIGNKINYQAWEAATQTGFAEIWGKRETQEDRVCIGTLPEFKELLEAEIDFVLRKTIMSLQETLVAKNISLSQGSTVCFVIICNSKLYVVNVGDSTAFLVTLTDQMQIKLLNHEIHQPTKLKEFERLREAGHTIRSGRIAGVLALSRALGDDRFEGDGLIHEPDIYQYDMDNPSKSFVVVACDGLTENEAITSDGIGNLLAKGQGNRSDEIAYALAAKAYEAGSEDNISVIVMPCEQTIPCFAAVFDGHGGDQVSDTLASMFVSTLKMTIACKLLMRAE